VVGEPREDQAAAVLDYWGVVQLPERYGAGDQQLAGAVSVFRDRDSELERERIGRGRGHQHPSLCDESAVREVRVFLSTGQDELDDGRMTERIPSNGELQEAAELLMRLRSYSFPIVEAMHKSRECTEFGRKPASVVDISRALSWGATALVRQKRES
jgi:hypothetical protein